MSPRVDFVHLDEIHEKACADPVVVVHMDDNGDGRVHTRLMDAFAVLALLPLAALIGLMVLTAVGSTRRGNHWALAMFSGMFFPVAWAAWYVRDERAH